MTKICYLHLGFHKTATTSIQLTCRNNAKLLKQGGIEQPRFLNEKNKISANHTGQIRDIFALNQAGILHSDRHPGLDKNRPNDNTTAGHRHALITLLQSDRNIFMSGEGLPLMPQKSLQQLMRTVNDHGFEIEPFVLVRAPYAYLNSALQQTIKRGRHYPWIGLGGKTNKGQRQADGSIKTLPNTIKAIRRLNQLFASSIRFYPFHQASIYPGGPVAFVLQRILHQQNLDQYVLATANQSLSNRSTRLQNLLNQNDPPLQRSKLEQLIQTLDRDRKPERFLLTEAEFELIQRKFITIQQDMEALLGAEFIEEDISFSLEQSNRDINKQLSDLVQQLAQMITTH